MSNDFDNLGDLFDQAEGNPGHNKQSKENIKRQREMGKYGAFVKKYLSMFAYNSAGAYGAHLVDSLFAKAMERFGDEVLFVSFRDVARSSRNRAVGEYFAAFKTVEKAQNAYGFLLSGSNAERFEDVVGDFESLVRAWKNHEHQYYQDGLNEVARAIETEKRGTKPTPSPSPTPKSKPSPGSTPAPSPSPLTVPNRPGAWNTTVPNRPGAWNTTVSPFGPESTPAPAPSPSPTPSPGPANSDNGAGSFGPKERDFWSKYGNYMIMLVSSDINENQTPLETSVTEALKTLGAKPKDINFNAILLRVANELGIIVEKEEVKDGETLEKSANDAKQEVETSHEKRRKTLEEYFKRLAATGLDKLGLKPYSEDRAWKYAKGHQFGTSIEAISTYVKLRNEFDNISLPALAKIARNRRMFFHPAYVYSLYETNPELALSENLPGQKYADFYALSSDASSDNGELALQVEARNTRAKGKRKASGGSKSPGESFFYNLSRAFGRRGFFGVGGGIIEAFSNLLEGNEDTRYTQEVSVEEVAKIIESARDEIKQATSDVDGSVDVNKIRDLNTARLVASPDLYGTAYRIAQEQRAQGGAVPPPSTPAPQTRSKPRKPRKKWKPFAGGGKAWGAFKRGFQKSFVPVLDISKKGWQAVVDDWHGVFGIDDAEFQRILLEKESEYSSKGEISTSWSDEFFRVSEEVNKLEEKQGAAVFEADAPEFTEADREQLENLRKEKDRARKKYWKEKEHERKAAKKNERKRRKTEEWKRRYKKKKERDSRQSAPQDAPIPSPNKNTEQDAPRKKWKVEAVDASGKPFTDVIEAETEEEVVASLNESGYFPTKVSPYKGRKPAKRRKGASPTSPSGGSGSPSGGSGSPSLGGGGFARLLGLFSALSALTLVVKKVTDYLNKMSQETRSFNDEFSQYNATVAASKYRQDAADFNRKVKEAAEAAKPYENGESPNSMMTDASIEYEDSKSRLRSAWNRKTAPLKSWAMEGFANLNEDIATVLNPSGVGDFISGLASPLFGNGSHDSAKEKIAFGIDKVIEKLTGIEGYAKESANERKKEKDAQSGGIKASALFRAIETMGDLKATQGFMQTHSPQNNWTAGFKTEAQYGRDASSPSKSRGSGLTYHTRKE